MIPSKDKDSEDYRSRCMPSNVKSSGKLARGPFLCEDSEKRTWETTKTLDMTEQFNRGAG